VAATELQDPARAEHHRGRTRAQVAAGEVRQARKGANTGGIHPVHVAIARTEDVAVRGDEVARIQGAEIGRRCAREQAEVAGARADFGEVVATGTALDV